MSGKGSKVEVIPQRLPIARLVVGVPTWRCASGFIAAQRTWKLSKNGIVLVNRSEIGVLR